jgi:hypothetical protein
MTYAYSSDAPITAGIYARNDHEALTENRLPPVVHPILRETLGFVPPEPGHTVLEVIDAWTERHPA